MAGILGVLIIILILIFFVVIKRKRRKSVNVGDEGKKDSDKVEPGKEPDTGKPGMPMPIAQSPSIMTPGLATPVGGGASVTSTRITPVTVTIQPGQPVKQLEEKSEKMPILPPSKISPTPTKSKIAAEPTSELEAEVELDMTGPAVDEELEPETLSAPELESDPLPAQELEPDLEPEQQLLQPIKQPIKPIQTITPTTIKIKRAEEPLPVILIPVDESGLREVQGLNRDKKGNITIVNPKLYNVPRIPLRKPPEGKIVKEKDEK